MNNYEIFKREYLSQWMCLSQEYEEAYKLWLWYFYQCELYDSKICTGKNEYEDYMPRTNAEYRLSNQNASRKYYSILCKRNNLKKDGINISEEDWQSAKRSLSRHKLKALEREYKHYFKD